MYFKVVVASISLIVMQFDTKMMSPEICSDSELKIGIFRTVCMGSMCKILKGKKMGLDWTNGNK